VWFLKFCVISGSDSGAVVWDASSIARVEKVDCQMGFAASFNLKDCTHLLI
jgi:hypothetical protein